MHKGKAIPKNANIKVPPTSPACKYTAFKAKNYRGTERNTFLNIKKPIKNLQNTFRCSKSFRQSIALFAATHT
jgi:hypothetical protein